MLSCAVFTLWSDRLGTWLAATAGLTVAKLDLEHFQTKSLQHGVQKELK